MYSYYFTRVPPGHDSERNGANHSAEIAYVFGNLLPFRPWQEVDRALSVLTFGETIEVRSGENGRAVDFFDVYWEKVRKGELPDPGL